jgi:hypothetical protein
LLSIAILGETLDVASDMLIFPRREKFYGRLTWELPNVGKRLLKEAGWCTGEIAALCRNFPDKPSLYYLSTWDCLKSGKNHSSCTGRYLANQVDEKTYKMRHTDPKCDFEHLPVEKPQAIFEILNEGGILVVLFTDAGKVHIQNSVPNDTSHVWSDGLGNAKSNTLPQCHLKYIQRLVDALYQDTVGNQQQVPF